MNARAAAVCLLDPRDGTLGERLAERRTGFDVTRVPDAGTGVDAGADCLVVAGPGTPETVADIEPGSAPVIAVLEPGDDAVDRALAAGATDVVTDAGSETVAVLANRIERVVDHRGTVDELRTVAARFDALTGNAGFAVLTIDEESVVQYASPAVEDVFGYEPAAIVGESLTELMPDRFRDRHRETVEHYLATGDRTLDWDGIELPGRHEDGTELPLRFSFSEGTVDGERRFSAVVEDISDERARRERLDEMASAIEGSMDGVALLDEDGRYQYVNDAHLEIYGFEDAEELLGERWDRLYDEAEIERFERTAMPTVHDEGQWRGEATGVTADGERFPQELTLTELSDGGLVCVVRDITDRVERRKRLREERQFVESVVDTLPDAFYVLDTDWTVSRWNDRLAEVTGYEPATLDGMDALELIAPEDRDRVATTIANVVETGEDASIQARLLTRQGDRLPYEFSGNRLTDVDDETIGLAGIGRDVSDRELRRQRLSVLSRVLRHDVRNRTTVIRGQAEHVREQVDDQALATALSRVEDAAAELAATSDRARQAEQILRGETARRQPVDLVDLVEGALEATDTDGMTIERELPDRGRVVGTGAVEDAVGELVQNVGSHVGDPTVRITIEGEGDTAALVVADDGPGIPPHERRALVDEEESPLSHGTGLGLWLVRWIVTVAGGHVTVRDSDLGGSAVVLSFPTV